MFRFLVTQSLRNRLMVLAASARSGAARNLQRQPAAGRCLPRSQQADRHHPDRIGRIGAAGSRAARQLSDRNPDERRSRGDAGALRFRRRALDRLCRVRLGHRHLSQPAADRRTAFADQDAVAAERGAPDGPGQLDHGPDPAGRDEQRQGVRDGSPRGRRLHRSPAAAHDPRRRPGHPDRRRGPPVSRCAESAGVAQPWRHL